MSKQGQKMNLTLIQKNALQKSLAILADKNSSDFDVKFAQSVLIMFVEEILQMPENLI